MSRPGILRGATSVARDRDVIIRDDRKNVITSGRFVDTNYPVEYWKSPSLKLTVFVSSTFTDTNLERDIIINQILPKLKEKAVRYHIDVTIVDMRWGVKDDNTIDHRTWIECSREIERCREESLSLFFISLQSDK